MKKNRQSKIISRLENSGIIIEQLHEKKHSVKDNVYKCLWNALIIFLFIFGLTNFFIDAFDLPCNRLSLTLFTAFISLYFAFFYLKRICFNLGYIFVLLFIIYYALKKYREINSGYSAILNLIIVKIDEEMNLTRLREFNEMYSNRYVSITCCFVIIITVLACIFNMWISRRNSILCPLILSVPVIEFSIYLNDEFSYVFLIVILLAFTMFIFTKQSDEVPVNYKKNQKTYKKKNKKIQILDRVVEHKWNIIFAGIFALITLFVSLISFTFISKTFLNSDSELKKKTNTVVSNIAMYGFGVLFSDNSASGSGGMNNGTFGNVGTITFDNQTDLEVTFVPYSTEPVYIPMFSANVYDRSNRRWYSGINKGSWNGAIYFEETDTIVINESEYYSSYQITDKKANGTMIINNIAAGDDLTGRVYYTDARTYTSSVEISKDTPAIIEYSPLLADYSRATEFYKTEIEELRPQGTIDDKSLELHILSNYTHAPTFIAQTLEEHWMIAFDKYSNYSFSYASEIVHAIELDYSFIYTAMDVLTKYFENEFQYTLSPGVTPEDRDFVEYFLETKQGFCVHYASTAALMLRSLGIPTKYVEGYSFDYTEYEDAAKYVGDADIENWYTGYNELGVYEPISIDLTDANAHAWIEVYLDDFGWVPVEFTVGTMADGGDVSGLSALLMSISRGEGGTGEQQSNSNNSTENTIEKIGQIVNMGLRNIVLIVFILILVYILGKKIYIAYNLYFTKEDKRAVNQYRFLVKTIRKDLIRKDKSNRDKIEKMLISHSDLIEILSKEYGVKESSAQKNVHRFEAFNYSESKENVNIQLLTNTFNYLIGCVVNQFGFFRRNMYKIYLWIPELENKP